MFRKLVSNISFSPALVGQLGFYAKRLSKEEATRRIGLIFTALALVVQMVTIYNPTDSADAAHPGDIIYGGVGSVSTILSAYGNNTKGFRTLLNSQGIDGTDLKSLKYGKIYTNGNWTNWARTSGWSSRMSSVSIGGHRYYKAPLADLARVDGNPGYYWGYTGKSARAGAFAFTKRCGNLQTSRSTPQAKRADMSITKTINGTKKITVKAGQLFSYAVKITNTGNTNLSGTVADSAPSGVYIVSASSGNIDRSLGHRHRWSTKFATLQPGKSITYTFKAKMNAYKAGVHTNLACVYPYGAEKKCSTASHDMPTPPKPVAACKSLQLSRINRTTQKLIGKSSTANGAKITSYTYTVKDATGKVSYQSTIPSTSLSSSTPQFNLQPGTYTATLSVATSVGTKTDDSCVQQLKVAAPEMCELNPDLQKNDPKCKPCELNPDLWIDDEDCAEKSTSGKTAVNLTQGGKDATKTTAQASDRIEYTIYRENTGKVPVKATFEEELTDVMEYATLDSDGGGNYDKDKKTLTWPEVTLKPDEKQTRIFTVKVLDKIPVTPQGKSMPAAHDCKMNNVFDGTMVSIPVNCDAPKVVEQTVKELPKTGPTENMIFAGILLAVVVFFYARSRQLKSEVRLIRKNVNAGTI